MRRGLLTIPIMFPPPTRRDRPTVANRQLLGEVDIASRDAVIATVLEAVTPATTVVVLDMSQVEFIDCAGLASILQARRRAAESGCAVQLTALSSSVRRLLELTNTAALLVDAGPS